jgi:hypothetical protein
MLAMSENSPIWPISIGVSKSRREHTTEAKAKARAGMLRRLLCAVGASAWHHDVEPRP